MQPAIHLQVNDAQLVNFFEEVGPRFAKKAIVPILRKGATPLKAELRNALPSNLKKFKAILAAKTTRSKTPSLSVGFRGRKVRYQNRRGVTWDAYQLVYWHNYGTLSRRDSSHTFSKTRRRVSAKWKGGLQAKNFVEKGMQAGLPKAEKKMLEEFDNEINKWANKNGFR